MIAVRKYASSVRSLARIVRSKASRSRNVVSPVLPAVSVSTVMQTDSSVMNDIL